MEIFNDFEAFHQEKPHFSSKKDELDYLSKKHNKWQQELCDIEKNFEKSKKVHENRWAEVRQGKDILKQLE